MGSSSTMSAPATRLDDSSLSFKLVQRAAGLVIRERRQGAPEPARLLYHRAHSLLRAIRKHLARNA